MFTGCFRKSEQKYVFHFLNENVFILGSALPEPSRHRPPGMIVVSTPQSNFLSNIKSSVNDMVLERQIYYCLEERDPKPRRMRKRTGHLLEKKEDFHEKSPGSNIRHIIEVASIAFLNLIFLVCSRIIVIQEEWL